MKKNVLIFGASGFIAAYLADELHRQGYAVSATDVVESGREFYLERNIPFVKIDITEQAEFAKLRDQRFDVVINLAALQPANFDTRKFSVRDYIQVNTVGTLNVLDYCRQSQSTKIIYGCSHRNTSGYWKKRIPIKEEDGRAQEYNGEYAMFGISESAAQDCVLFYAENYGIKGVIFRLPPVYGFGPHLEIFKNGKPIKTGFQTFIENASEGKPLEAWGDTTVGRDIIYVKDVVDAFIRAIETETASGLYNISTAYALTLREEIETIAKVFGDPAHPPTIVDRPEKTHTMDAFVYDNDKARRELGWSPRYDFEQMLMDMIAEQKSKKFDFLWDKRQQMFNVT